MLNEEAIERQNKIAMKRRLFAQARAIIQRGRAAGIPDKYIRIKENEFSDLLCPNYHKNPKEFSKIIYQNPQFLFKKSFIIIDGGDFNSRKKAGFAILFRMIACDKHGQVYDCSQLSSEFQTIKPYGTENRNDLVKRVREEQIFFLNEFHQKKFSVHLTDSGNFFDQLLEYRDDYSKPTIITFSAQLSCGTTYRENIITDDRCGNYLAMLSQSDIKKNENVFRVRVK